MTRKHVTNPLRPVHCENCGAQLGLVEILKVHKKPIQNGAMTYPWSLAGAKKVEVVPLHIIQEKERKLRSTCTCHNWSSIPD